MITVVVSKQGQLIRDNKTNPSSDNKHIVVESVSVDMFARYQNDKRVTMVVPGTATALTRYMKELKKYPDARIVTFEFIESEVPEEFEADYNPKLDADAQKAPFIKVAGETNIPCTKDGENILSFKRLDLNGDINPPKIKHDNGEDIKLANAIIKAKADADAKAAIENALKNAEVKTETPEVVTEDLPA